jgi:predicted SAM-dependent methyltransferase
MVKINFGCGTEQRLPGWINVDRDLHAAPDVVADLSKEMPFPSASVDFIFSEALLEQLNLLQSAIFLRECRRVLKPTGVMRLLAADLEKFARTYLNNPDWLVETWETTTGVPLKTRKACEVLNAGIRVGQFFFDGETFQHLARGSGFRVEKVEYRKSRSVELRDIDIRSPETSINMYFECFPIETSAQ